MQPMRLTKKIVAVTTTDEPRYGMAADGYTVKSGAPTCYMIMLEGEKRRRRVMIWQFSNAGTIFVRIKGVPFIVDEHEIHSLIRRDS